MPRKLRIEYPGAIYHVMSRGDRREAIFHHDQDRELFLRTLGEACLKADWQIHAYCLMPNHFHMVVETPKGNLVAGMKWFLGTYTIRFNCRHKLSGHLFSGRYKSLVVDGSDHGYLKTVCDYVHLNPVRAQLLVGNNLESYWWSSYLEYLKSPDQRVLWLRVDRLLGEMRIPQDSAAGRQEFQRQMTLCSQETNPLEWQKIRRGWCWGEDKFRKELLAQMGQHIGESHYGAERQESAEAKAERIVTEELSKLGWLEEEVRKSSKSDPEKIKIARRLRSETTVTLKWIAARLQMGTWTYLSSLMGKPTTPPVLISNQPLPEAAKTQPAEIDAILWD